jgi:hypothetical protein
MNCFPYLDYRNKLILILISMVISILIRLYRYGDLYNSLFFVLFTNIFFMISIIIHVNFVYKKSKEDATNWFIYLSSISILWNFCLCIS